MSVTHDGSVIARHNVRDNLLGGNVVDIVLRRVQHNLAELELPVILRVIDSALVRHVLLYIKLLQNK